MNTNTKKFLFVALSVLILVIGIGVYFIFFSNSPSSSTGRGNGNPFGTGNGSNQTGGNGSSSQNPPSGTGGVTQNGELARLWKISENPVSGATIAGTASSTIIRFVEKATGHIYDANPLNHSVVRISNTTIPKSERIVWGKNAKSLLFQYENGGIIKTYYARIATTTATTTEQGLVGGKYLSDGIGEVVSSALGDKIFYLLSAFDTNGFVVANFDGSKESIVSTSDIRGWLLSWPKDGLFSITTKPSSSALGYSYFIDPKTKILKKTLGDMFGLTTLSDKNGENILYSESGSGSVNLKMFTKKQGSRISTSLQTLPEKCVWGTKNSSVFYCAVPKDIPKGDYPDLWYQGRVSFSDSVWLYDLNSGATEEVLDLSKEAGADIDIVDPKLSSSGGLLIFRNKKDFSLWGLKIDPSKIPEFFD